MNVKAILTPRGFAKHVLALFLSCLLGFCSLAVAEPKSPQQADWYYTLRPSDSLQSVAQAMLDRRYSWTDISQYNRIDNTAALQAGSIIRIPMDWLKQQPQPATTMSVSGSVLIKRSRDTSFSVLRANTRINVGDEISTRDGSVIVQFADGSLLHIDENSNIVFNRLSHFGQTGMVDTRMRLKKGSVSTDIQPLVKGSRFEISTPSAVAAVRGTRFRLETEAKATRIEVMEGEVEFSHEHGTTVVSAGEGARVHADSALIERKRLSPPPKSNFAGTTVSDLPTTLTWDQSAPAKSYRYEIKKPGKAEPALQSGELSQPQLELDNVKNGDYLVAMRSRDEDGYEGMDSSSPLRVQVDAEIPELLAPLNGSTIDNLNPTFRWQFSDQSMLGRLDVARDAAFEQLVTSFDYEKTTSITLQAKLEPGEYYWRVSGLGDDSSESKSETRKLAIRGNMKPVKILSVNYIENQVGLFWNTVDEANGYILQVSDNARFDNILKEEALGKASAHLKLTPGKRYYARVKGIGNELYRSEYGPVKELFIEKSP